MDVNGLKPVNDTLGHAAGDELLQGAAECMEQCFGNYGKVYRMGGDEFAAIIFVNTRRLKRVQQEFDDVVRGWSGQLVKSVSISCGYVSSDEKDWESFERWSRLQMRECTRTRRHITGRRVSIEGITRVHMQYRVIQNGWNDKNFIIPLFL